MYDYFKFLPTIDVNGTKELDLLKYPLTEIESFLKRQPRRFLLSSAYLGRFDLVSEDVYRNPSFWWVACVVNLIFDMFDEDELVGKMLRFPDPLDVHDWVIDLRGKS